MWTNLAAVLDLEVMESTKVRCRAGLMARSQEIEVNAAEGRIRGHEILNRYKTRELAPSCAKPLLTEAGKQD